MRAYKARRLKEGKLRIAISSMPNDKAPGIGGVIAEVLKLGGEPLTPVLAPLYGAVIRCGIIPAQ